MTQGASVRVTPFEAAMLRVLRRLFGIERGSKSRAAIRNAHRRPMCIHREALRLVEDTLAKGTIRFLARSDGWRHDRCLCGGSLREGRLWQRHSLEELRLTFSPHSLNFLIELTVRAPGTQKLQLKGIHPEQLTAGDRLFFYIAYAALRDENLSGRLAPIPHFATNSLCRLAWPEDFAGLNPSCEFELWLRPPGVVLLESLQHELLARLLDFEEKKQRAESGDDLLAMGRVQCEVLGRFLDAVESSKRYDVLRFLLAAAAGLSRRPPHDWILAQPFYRSGGIRERLELCRAAASWCEVLLRLQQMRRSAESVGYFDEGYIASQFLKSLWERYNGNQIAERCSAWLRGP